MALGEADDDVARLRKALTDPKRSAKTTEEYTQALVRLHRKLGSARACLAGRQVGASFRRPADSEEAAAHHMRRPMWRCCW